MKKVYCKNCKWYEWGIGCEVWEKTIIEKDYFSPHHRVKTNKSYNMEDQNEDNDCPDYKRKWWKVWVV